MIPGIDPKVDIAFRKLFASPAWPELPVSLINAVVGRASTPRVVELDLLNPYSQKISPDDKLTILDVKARDEQGRTFDVEMQMELVPSLPRRLLFYWSQMYAQQLVEGDNYATLRPAISICFLNQDLFPGRDAYHSVFRLLDPESGLCLTRDLQIHVIEIPKFTLDLDSLETPLDFWLYFFKNGIQLDADALPATLAMSMIRRAMEVLKVFSQNQIEREVYESRLKAQRDHQAFVLARDEAVQARDEAEQRATRSEQRATQSEQRATQSEQRATQSEQRVVEAEHEIKQGLSRQIQLCQRLLGHSPTDGATLMDQPINDLRTLAERLEQELPEE